MITATLPIGNNTTEGKVTCERSSMHLSTHLFNHSLTDDVPGNDVLNEMQLITMMSNNRVLL